MALGIGLEQSDLEAGGVVRDRVLLAEADLLQARRLGKGLVLLARVVVGLRQVRRVVGVEVRELLEQHLVARDVFVASVVRRACSCHDITSAGASCVRRIARLARRIAVGLEHLDLRVEVEAAQGVAARAGLGGSRGG